MDDVCCANTTLLASSILKKGIKPMHLYFLQEIMNLIIAKKQLGVCWMPGNKLKIKKKGTESRNYFIFAPKTCV